MALTPLIYAVFFSENKGRWSPLRHALLGYCAGVAFFWTSFSWLITVTGLGWFMVSLYMGLYLAFWAWFIGLVRPRENTAFLSSRSNLRVAFFCALAWAAHEWLRGVAFSGFGWNNLGTALHGNLAMIQIAEVTGVTGLSFLVAFTNVIIVATVWRFAMEIQRGKPRPHYDFSFTLVLVVLVFAFGIRALQQHQETVPLRVAAVQANIPQNEKFNTAFEAKIFATYTRLTEAALGWRPQLLLWPEAATPRGMFSDERNNQFVLQFATRTEGNFMLGSIDFDEEGDYNIAALLTDRGRDIQVYRKVHLVPFGEYIPFRHSFPLFAKIAGDQVPGDFKSGGELTILKTRHPELRLAPLICFEDTLGDLTRKFVLKGAQVLVNVTNDGWFQHSQAAEQQVANAVFRAVENRRPLVRCANTGVTCFIDSFGRITQSLRAADGNHFIEGVLFGSISVPTHGRTTFYTRHGEWFPISAGAITLLFIAVHFARGTK